MHFKTGQKRKVPVNCQSKSTWTNVTISYSMHIQGYSCEPTPSEVHKYPSCAIQSAFLMIQNCTDMISRLTSTAVLRVLSHFLI